MILYIEFKNEKQLWKRINELTLNYYAVDTDKDKFLVKEIEFMQLNINGKLTSVIENGELI